MALLNLTVSQTCDRLECLLGFGFGFGFTTLNLKAIRDFKILERGRLEERLGRRGPGSSVRCSRREN